MLAAAGVESYFILVNTDRGTIDPAFATGVVFNHAIIAIRLPQGVASPDFFATYDHPTLGKLLIFDPTAWARRTVITVPAGTTIGCAASGLVFCSACVFCSG